MKSIKTALILFSVLICLLCGCTKINTDISALLTCEPEPTGEPLTESQVISLSLQSSFLGREVPFLLYLPKGYGGGEHYPVWYGLHGYSANEKQWINTAGVDKVADRLIDSGEIEPMIMVFPLTRYDTIKEIQQDMDDDGKRSESKINQFLCRELVPYIDANYDTIVSPDDRYIGGFSMGGAIALNIALLHTDMFGKAGCYTPAVPSGDFSGKQLEQWLFPNEDTDKIADVVAFASQKRFDKLHIYINCGNVNDPFSAGVQSLYEALQKRGVETEFEIFNGGHDIHNIMDHLEQHLKFYCGKN